MLSDCWKYKSKPKPKVENRRQAKSKLKSNKGAHMKDNTKSELWYGALDPLWRA